METHHLLASASDHAQLITYAGGAASVLFWGLHVNEICAVISTAVAICGLMLQIYVAWKRLRTK